VAPTTGGQHVQKTLGLAIEGHDRTPGRQLAGARTATSASIASIERKLSGVMSG
jgi:hypothetical protein